MDHFKKAESYIHTAERAYRDAIEATDETVSNSLLTRAHYLVAFANAHTTLSQIQTQREGFSHVGKMAEVVEKDVNRNIAVGETTNKEGENG